MKKNILSLLILAALAASCGQRHLATRLIGGDRDEHGCIGSAGYTYSYALHDCIRVWETGTRLDHNGKSVFAVFSADSAFCEIIGIEGERPICRRRKQSGDWRCRRRDDRVTLESGRLCFTSNDGTVYREISD